MNGPLARRASAALAAALVAVAAAVLVLRAERAGAGPGELRAAADVPRVERPVLDADRGLAPGWRDWGWSPHTIARGAPASLELARYGGLLLAKSGGVELAEGSALRFRYRAPPEFGSFLEVRLETASGQPLAHVRVAAGRGRTLPDGFVEVELPLTELDPSGRPFERLVFHAWRPVGPERVLLDRVAFLEAPPPPPPPPRKASFVLDCTAPGRPISPYLYGIGGAGAQPEPVWAAGPTARRWGGNSSSRYNWELGDAFNTNRDWFFRNVRSSGRPGYGWQDFLAENRSRGVRTALTVPMIGWVAKDTSSYAFPVSRFGRQQAVAPDLPDAGNGIGPDGRPLAPGPPELTSVASTPGSIERWVRQIRDRDAPGERSVHLYLLDNEPSLWHETHRDIHPEPLGYDELLERTLAYAAAVRRADPDALVGGPAEWGWLGYLYSARDKVAGVGARPDRRAHGDVPLIPWYLRRIAEQERATGARILDVLDVHFYPALPIGLGTAGGTDRATSALRIRSTRALWDPTYVDESWIGEPIRLVPRLREWIAENHPGLGISIGEWNFGAEGHMSGGLAVAEALGRFGVEGVDWAFYWTSPAPRTPAFWAFRAYRDFDGEGGRFLDRSVPVRGEATLASLFASRDEGGGRAVLVLLDLDPDVPLDAAIDAASCGRVTSARAFTYAGGAAGFAPAAAAARGARVEVSAAPYSITVLELALARH